jgi:hypothetical protein
MYMGNTTAKSRGDVAGGDEIKNTMKYREGGRQSKRNGKGKGKGKAKATIVEEVILLTTLNHINRPLSRIKEMWNLRYVYPF